MSDGIRIWLACGGYTLISAEDAHIVDGWNLYRMTGERNLNYVFGKRMKGGVLERLNLHRAIMQPAEGMVVDHINGDRLDNRRSNLRVCSAAENLCNRLMSRANKSGFKGVSWDKGKFVAQITFKGVNHGLGRYSTALEAAEAYDAAAKRLHGEFAKTNAMLQSERNKPFLADARRKAARRVEPLPSRGSAIRGAA